MSFYSALARELNQGSTRAALGLLGFRNDALREHLRHIYESPPGTDGAFLADPVFEAMFGWHTSAETIAELSGNLLHADTISALMRPAGDLTDPWDPNRRPYQHQLMAWRALQERDPARSVLVSSGTGSGKTECFLVPILDDMAREADQSGHVLTGIRALFLYPLNALIKSQRDRLTGWLGSDSFHNRVRYCLYKGDLPEQTPPHQQGAFPCEVRGRDVLRANPPPILVTNATMLEYMLVRDKDRPIIDASQGKLRWIVIDEAHNYIGSQAAELTLLLRRVMHAFDCRPEQVHFVATSATIAGNGEETNLALQKFLSDVAGVPPERITVVTGQRFVPALEPEWAKQQNPLPPLAELHQQTEPQKYATLASNPKVRGLRESLTLGARRLTDLARGHFGDSGSQQRDDMLELLDICTEAKIDPPDTESDPKPFLPLRGHFFHRAQSGLWACVNATCPERQGTRLDNSAWGFGKLFLDRRRHCDACESPVYELVQCRECGAEYLSAEIVDIQGYRLLPIDYPEDEDEFQQDQEITESEDEEQADVPHNLGRVLLIKDDAKYATREKVLPDCRLVAVEDASPGIIVSELVEGDEGLTCACCGKREIESQSVFQPIRLGAPFLLQSATPTLLRHMKPALKPNEALPWQGRRLISFTDSRQGTARFATKLQQTAERNYIESFLLHRISAEHGPINNDEIHNINQQILALDNAISAGAPNLESIRDGLIDRVNEKLNPQPARLSWTQLREGIAHDCEDNGVFHTLRQNTNIQSATDLAELCLLREFMLRPKRQYSLEGLGLLRLRYLCLEQITENTIPVILRQQNVTLAEWRDLAQMVVDHYVRANLAVQVTRQSLRWLGFPGIPNRIVAPGHVGDKRFKHWPDPGYIPSRRSWIIRLLTHAFELDLARDNDLGVMREIVLGLWSAVRTCLTPGDNNTYFLELGSLNRTVSIAQMGTAWVCPVTRRLLPTTFRGITPYLPTKITPENAHLARCESVDLPVLPHAFWNGVEPDVCEKWLENDPPIQKLRSMGLWTDLNDRIARFSPYFRTVEHSAQIHSNLLTQRETAFREGRVNLMSCSTTMEMGVDIGGLTGVAMNNVPPHPANFLQRAGRAGRRGETAAVSFTLCKSTPHGAAVFKNPLWPFTTPLALPKVSLQSERIVQRHVNALCLAEFLQAEVHQNPIGMTSGGFFETADDTVTPASQKFQDWLRNNVTQLNELCQGVTELTRGTCLNSMPVEGLFASTHRMLSESEEQWTRQRDALQENLQEVQTPAGNTFPENAVNLQLQRLRNEYLLRELANSGFLPGYGFPIGVVALNTKTKSDLNHNINNLGREDNRMESMGQPSRDLVYALRDYAPGTDTVINQRVYRSAGVTLNWHLPADIEAAPEIQSLRWAWRCGACGNSGTRPTMPNACLDCGEEGPTFTRRQYLQPGGFAVDIRYEPHNDISTPQYIPVRDPWVSMNGAEWLTLPTADMGRYRYSDSGTLFHYTDGLHGRGYGLCLKCGRADSMLTTGEFSSAFVDNNNHFSHRRLRGGRNEGANVGELLCPGSETPQGHLLLGVEIRTDIFELQLKPSPQHPITEKVAYSLGVALRQALAERLGIETRELGSVVYPSRDADGQATYTVCLHDTASDGAGYASQAMQTPRALFERARAFLNCPQACDSACHACLLTYDTQHHAKVLDRHAALSLLDDDFLLAMELPRDLQVYGPDTCLEVEPLSLALQRELRQRLNVKEVRIHLGGDSKLWEPLEWRIREDLLRLKSQGMTIRLLCDQQALDGLANDQKAQFGAFLMTSGIDAYPVTQISGKSPSSILEIGHDKGSIRWACNRRDAAAPTPDWGSGEQGNIHVIGRFSTPLHPISENWKPITPDQLRGDETNATELAIRSELNGSLNDFGMKAWDLIGSRVPKLHKILQGNIPLTRVVYHDRYLKSPLTLALLRSFLKGILGDGGIGPETELIIATSKLDNRYSRSPYLIEHDWNDSLDRQSVIKNIFANGFGRFGYQELLPADLPHSRRLLLTWGNDVRWELRFDHGFGHWKANNRIQFPFDRSDFQQAKELIEVNIQISDAHSGKANGPQYPTYFYIIEQRGS